MGVPEKHVTERKILVSWGSRSNALCLKDGYGAAIISPDMGKCEVSADDDIAGLGNPIA
jgi:hypothetical protein